MKTASPRTGVIQLWMPLSRRAATWLDLGRREGVCESNAEGKVCESVSGPEAPKDVTHAPRERGKRAVTGRCLSSRALGCGRVNSL